ncbi:MlaD family protein [Conexibacter sp. SYSU D00693]|uniref:MlaD family protein n=1 Tax=Conexibacter sp. SYSU D00693 TaxID=2812560 RepID=UPI00196A9AC4|nr:MlaD family protein [Conexibacter sp. SYSU D00693]
MTLLGQVRRYAVEMAAVVGMVLVALAVGGYILSNQRLRFPWEDVYEVTAAFSTAQAVTPGQGQTIAVAGVDVGEVREVRLVDGRALVTFEVDRTKLPRIHRDATMLLRPKTGLQDMSVQLDPGTEGSPLLGQDDVLPVSRTLPNVNLDEVLAGLDQDTRLWLRTIAQATGRGLQGRARDVRAILRTAAPSLERTAKVTEAITARRGELRRLVGSLRRLTDAAAARDDDVRALVTGAHRTFGAIARQDDAVRGALERLPGTLRATTDALSASRPLSRRLPQAVAALRPALADLEPALPRVDPLLRDARPAARRIRGLAVQARPVLRSARPAVRDLLAQTPDLSSSFDVLRYVTNELGHNPEGPEEGYLFWTAWFLHNAGSILSIDDAQGAVWRGGLIVSCSTLGGLPEELHAVLRVITQLPACPADASGQTPARRAGR